MTRGFTVRKVNIILFTTVRNVQPLLRQFSRNTQLNGTNNMQMSYVRFNPKSENKCFYERTAINLRPEVGTASTAPNLLNSQSLSDIVCANPVHNLVQIYREIRRVDRNLITSPCKDVCHCQNFHGILNSHRISRKFKTRFIQADGQ
jgi:hypothetical protein